MGLALLGASASGKTSLSKALVGIWPAQHGVVRLDGAAIDQWTNEDLGRHIGYLPQDVALFDGTVAENICRFDRRCHFGRHPESRADRRRPRHHPSAARGIFDPDRPGRHVAVGRPAATRSALRAPYSAIRSWSCSTSPTPISMRRARMRSAARSAPAPNKSIVIVISHRPNAFAVLDMAMVLYEGKSIAFGSSEEVFARVRGSAKATASRTQHRTDAEHTRRRAVPSPRRRLAP